MDLDKINILRGQFQSLGIDFKQPISEKIIFNYLDLKSGGQFDRSIALELYQHTLNQFNDLTIDNFIQTYVKAEETLRIKISQTKTELGTGEQSIAQTKRTITDLIKREQLNEHGVMEDSQISITLLSGQINRLTISMEVYVMMQCNENSYQTSAGNECAWNQTFNFPIHTGMEQISIQVKAYQGTNTIDIGECHLRVDQFKDQQQNQISVEVNCNYPYSGSLEIIGVWMYSKVQYLQELLIKQDNNQQSLRQDLKDYEIDLETIYKPFPQLLEPSEISPLILQTPQKYEQFDQWELYKLNNYLVAFFTLLVFLCSFNRCVFLDILIILVYSLKYKDNQLDSKTLKLLSLASFCSFALDIFWITIYLLPLWVDIDTPEVGIDKLVVITSCLIFPTKLGFSLICLCLARQDKAMPHQFSDNQENEISNLQYPIYPQPFSNDESIYSYQQQ